MTFPEMLKSALDAEDVRTAAAQHLADSRDMLADAEVKDAEAEAARVAAHLAIHDRLVELGHHSVRKKDGTYLVYHAIDGEPGWAAYQPIPSDEE